MPKVNYLLVVGCEHVATKRDTELKKHKYFCQIIKIGFFRKQYNMQLKTKGANYCEMVKNNVSGKRSFVFTVLFENYLRALYTDNLLIVLAAH